MIKAYRNSERIRVGNLFSTKHRAGFGNKEKFAKWFLSRLSSQKYCCYYCETSIFTLISLIQQKILKPRKIGHGKTRGEVLEIDKEVNELGYTPKNCVLACCYCNNDKSSIIDGTDYKTFFGPARKVYFQHLVKMSGNQK